MIERRRAARPTSPSTNEPSESGPRWTSVALIAASRDVSPTIPQIPHMELYSTEVSRRPVYWKQAYASRSQRHKAWVRQQARREAALKAQRGPSLWQRLRALLTRRA